MCSNSWKANCLVVPFYGLHELFVFKPSVISMVVFYMHSMWLGELFKCLYNNNTYSITKLYNNTFRQCNKWLNTIFRISRILSRKFIRTLLYRFPNRFFLKYDYWESGVGRQHVRKPLRIRSNIITKYNKIFSTKNVMNCLAVGLGWRRHNFTPLPDFPKVTKPDILLNSRLSHQPDLVVVQCSLPRY